MARKKSKTFTLYSEAKAWKEKLEKSLDDGIKVQGLSMTVVGMTMHARPGELLGLVWQCVNWDNQTLSISEQIQRVDGEGLQVSDLKTDSSKRENFLGQEVLAFLKGIYMGLPIADVSFRSGHSKISTTLDFYVHNTKGQSDTGDIMDGLLPDSS